MKLLFDHNISPDLTPRLGDLFPESEHVYHLNLHEEDDSIVWAYAREHGFIVVSKDADFSELSIFSGFPPKLLWLRIGNCSTADIELIVRSNHSFIAQLSEDDERHLDPLLTRRELMWRLPRPDPVSTRFVFDLVVRVRPRCFGAREGAQHNLAPGSATARPRLGRGTAAQA